MALLRMTEKKLAANRANAKKSKGPVTPEGKEKVSGNACKHHLYARKFTMPPEWKKRIWAVVQPCIAGVEDPVERAYLFDYVVLAQWSLELAGWQTRILDKSIAKHRNYCYGLRACVQDHLYFAIETRIIKLRRQAERARIGWVKAKNKNRLLQTIPQIVENAILTAAPKTLISAVSASAAPKPVCHTHRKPARRQVRHAFPQHRRYNAPRHSFSRMLPSRAPPAR